MKITILTLFPEMFVGPFSESILKRAQEKGLLEISIVNIRDFGIGSHKVVDDKTYGGGVGMVMKVDVLDQAIVAVKDEKLSNNEQQVVLLDPRGETFAQNTAKNFAHLKHLILLCGHYEGIDERVRSLVDATISIGDFVLTGGEIPAMAITDAVARLLSGVLKDEATEKESFSLNTDNSFIENKRHHANPDLIRANPLLIGEEGKKEGMLLEHPHYTTPREYKGMEVPQILLSGDHKKIEEWKKEQALEVTKKHRPDLLKSRG